MVNRKCILKLAFQRSTAPSGLVDFVFAKFTSRLAQTADYQRKIQANISYIFVQNTCASPVHKCLLQ